MSIIHMTEIYQIKGNVLYGNPNHWTDLDEIWYGGGHQGWEGS